MALNSIDSDEFRPEKIPRNWGFFFSFLTAKKSKVCWALSKLEIVGRKLRTFLSNHVPFLVQMYLVKNV